MRRRPDVQGDNGYAWKVPNDRMGMYAAVHPEKVDPLTVMATCALWYFNGRGFHSTIPWWAVSVIDLERRGEQPEPLHHYPGSEYELLVVRLDPRAGTPPVNGEGGMAVVEGEMAFQFHGLTREQASDVCTFFVDALCGGYAHPDQTWANQNRERLTRLVRDYYIGRYGGAVRVRYPEVDPLTGIFTGFEEEGSWVTA